MMVIVLLILLAALCFFIARFCRSDLIEYLVEFIGLIVAFVGCIFVVFALFTPLMIQGTYSGYTALRITVENARANTNISQFERVALINQIIDNNKLIEEHRTFHDSIWIGCFYSKKIADLDYILINNE